MGAGRQRPTARDDARDGRLARRWEGEAVVWWIGGREGEGVAVYGVDERWWGCLFLRVVNQ